MITKVTQTENNNIEEYDTIRDFGIQNLEILEFRIQRFWNEGMKE